jgi:molecular chaperone DnaJ
MSRDYYDVLGLKPGASESEIRSAYKKLARRYHPDVNPGSKSAEESFKEVSEAYQVLSDPQKRRQYDAMRGMGGSARGFEYGPGARGSTRGPGGAYGFDFRSVDLGSGGFEDLGGIFSDLFGRAAPAGSAPRRGTDLEYEASVDFDEAARGTTIKVPLARRVTCPACNGAGTTTGKGGRSAECRRCGGEGTIRSSETTTVRIPAGAEDGARVRVAGSGEAGRRGGPPGDLYIVLRVKPHRYFRREGNDIVLDVPLSYSEAALGTKVEVPTLDGKATVTIPAGSRSGQRLRLRGKGIAGRDGKDRGDQIVVVGIVPPRRADRKVTELLEELEQADSGDPRRDLDW